MTLILTDKNGKNRTVDIHPYEKKIVIKKIIYYGKSMERNGGYSHL